MNTIIILASSRNPGNTAYIADRIVEKTGAELVDIGSKSVGYYDYAARNQSDDYQGIVDRMLEADTIIFASPVYWFTMSAQMKTFFDRFTDLITVRKEAGRELAGKKAYLLISGSEPELPAGFEEPFQLTFEYFNMSYMGNVYCYFIKSKEPDENVEPDLAQFIEELNSAD